MGSAEQRRCWSNIFVRSNANRCSFSRQCWSRAVFSFKRRSSYVVVGLSYVVVLDFLSNHPLHMKMNVVNNFIKRVRELSTNLTDQEVGRIIDQQLALNHYPRPLRHRLINRRNRQREVAETSASEVSYKPLVHVEHLTNRLKKLLKKDYPDIVLATRNRRTVETFFTNTKDVIPPAMKTNIIYTR